MPTQPRTNKGVYVELPTDVVANLRRLAERNGRSFRDEVEHAARRHLAQPPVVEVTVEPLITTTVQTVPAKAPRARKTPQAKM